MARVPSLISPGVFVFPDGKLQSLNGRISLELERSEDASENVDRTSELLVREIRCRTEAQCIDAIVGEDSLVL